MEDGLKKPPISHLTRATLRRRDVLKALAGSTLFGRESLAREGEKAFKVRATMECGWNIFRRKGYSTDPKDISVNYRYLDYLREAGLNWVIVFWTNAPGFDGTWAKASRYAHACGIRVARAVYVFAGGEPETEMGEPNVPAHLVRMSARGTKSALCPHDAETREWVAKALERRVEPDIDGIVFEPPPETFQNCICDQCRALNRFQLDSLMASFVTDRLKKINPDLEVMLHMNATWDRAFKQSMAAGLSGLPGSIRYIFGWNTDHEQALIDWLDADHRFQAFTHLSRAILFPGGKPSPQSAEERAAMAFRWARLAADRGKPAYSYDWRMFAGTEWFGHEKDAPTTRLTLKIPASIRLMGATMKHPYLDEKGRRSLLRELRATSEWDLDSPVAFYQGSSR
jgi:hypothetical protein